MPLQPHKIKDYDTVLRNEVTNSEGFSRKTYYKKDDTPTIGYGLTLIDKGTKQINNDALKAIEDSGITISKEDKKTLETIKTKMQEGASNDTIRGLVDKLSLDLGNEATGLSVFEKSNATYESMVEEKLGKTLYKELEGTKERVALVDMAYNGGAGPDSPLAGPGLKHALADGNRAEAWFQIRYDSNGGTSRRDFGNGMAKRRVAESDMFGLYDEKPTAEGMKDIIRMARFHKPKIDSEEKAFPAQYAGDNSLSAQIQPAKDYLIENFGKNVEIDGKLIVGNDTINDNSANRGKTNIDDDLQGTAKNDLIFGEKGNDILRGNAGDDVLYGGEGNDKLYGGSGNDTYIAGAGDTIGDSDKQGTIYFNSNLLSGVKHKISEGVYEDKMFTYTEKDKNLIIAQKDDTSKSITVENWNSSKNMLGIELSDTKEEVAAKAPESLGVTVDMSKLTLIQKEETTDYSKYLPEHLRPNQEQTQDQESIHPPSIQEYLAQFKPDDNNTQNLDNNQSEL